MSTKSIWMPCLLLLLMTFSLPSRSLAAGSYFVKADATGANNGASWANAFTDLQNALAAAQWGEEIWVAAGTYKPTSGTDRNISFVLVAGVGVYGGFAGTETTRDQRDWKAHETILRGDIGTSGTNTDNSYHVVTGANLAILDGFTVTGGNTASSGSGGGMYNSNGASPTVTNCTFSGNTASGGGGMYNSNSASPTVTNCTFSGNTAGYDGGGGGGGMYNAYGSPTVTNCTFSGNTANGNGGGGMCNLYASPTVINCIFSGNTAGGNGGGVYNYSSDLLTVTNCTFSGNTANSASYGGGGMYNYQASPTVTNCILWGNNATLGPEVYRSGAPLIICHCDIRGSGGSGAQWNPALGTDGGGNIMTDPRFADAVHPAGADGVWMTADDGLRLQADSPCINTGYPNGAPATDILNNPRSGLPDIGAYEYQPPLNGVAVWSVYK